MSTLNIIVQVALMFLCTVGVFSIVFYVVLSTVLGVPAVLLTLAALIGFIILVVNQIILAEEL